MPKNSAALWWRRTSSKWFTGSCKIVPLCYTILCYASHSVTEMSYLTWYVYIYVNVCVYTYMYVNSQLGVTLHDIWVHCVTAKIYLTWPCYMLWHSKELPDLLSEPVVVEIAERHNKTAAQVLLRYSVQRGIAVIPKSINPSRIRSNIQVLLLVYSLYLFLHV